MASPPDPPTIRARTRSPILACPHDGGPTWRGRIQLTSCRACSLHYRRTSQLKSLPSRGGGLRACPERHSGRSVDGVTAARATETGHAALNRLLTFSLLLLVTSSSSRPARVCASAVTCDNTGPHLQLDLDCSENGHEIGWRDGASSSRGHRQRRRHAGALRPPPGQMSACQAGVGHPAAGRGVRGGLH